MSGSVRADVESVTISTPHDVRTLIPSGRSRSFIAAYDGNFTGGEIAVSLRFRDGSTRLVERFALAP